MILKANTISALLALSTEKRTEAPALIYGESVTSYTRLQERSYCVATQLTKLGLNRGDRVAIWLPNVPAWLEIFLACAHIGVIPVAINTRFRSSEVANLLKRSGAKILFFWPRFKGINFLDILEAIEPNDLSNVDNLVVYSEDNGIFASSHIQKPIITYDALFNSGEPITKNSFPNSGCIIFTTSGTTKLPKLVLHSQERVASHAYDVAQRLGYDAPRATILQATPFCGVFGFSQALAALSGGATLICLPTFDVLEVIYLIGKYRINHIDGSDEMFRQLLEAQPGKNGFPTVKFGGYANFTPALKGLVSSSEQQGLKLIGLYGASELLAYFATQRADAPINKRKRMGGSPVSPVAEVRVRDPEDGKIKGIGEIGELEFKTPNIMIGYYNDEAATKEAFTYDGFFRSGDLGRLCKDGTFEFLSRKDDSLRLGGFLVNPEEIESHIQDYSEVDSCQVVGFNGSRGTCPIAFVLLRKNSVATEEELIQHCRAGMAKFKVPFRVFFIDKFPTTTGPNGTKIQRSKLRQMALDRLTSDSSY